jgi:hypothetical protein
VLRRVVSHASLRRLPAAREHHDDRLAVPDEAVGRIVTGVVVESRGGGVPAGDHSGDEGEEIYGSWLSSRHP